MRIFLMLLFTLSSLVSAEDKFQCQKLSESFKAVHERLASQPCEGSENCQSLKDHEEEFQSLLAEHRIRQGIGELHQDLLKRKKNPETVLFNKQKRAFLNAVFLKRALEKTFEEDPKKNFLLNETLIQDPQDIIKLCEQKKSYKKFCSFFRSIKDTSAADKIFAFAQDLREVNVGIADPKNNITAQQRIDEVHKALKAVHFKTDPKLFKLYGANNFMTLDLSALNPKTFDDKFQVQITNDLFKKRFADIQEMAKVKTTFTKKQEDLFIQMDEDLKKLDIDYSSEELKSCLLKYYSNKCARDFFPHHKQSMKELEKKISEKKEKVLNFKNNLVKENSDLKKYLFAENYLIKELKNQGCENYREQEFKLTSCDNAGVDVYSGDLFSLGENVKGIVDQMLNEELKEESIANIKKAMCSYKDFPEIKRFCPQKEKETELTDYSQALKDLEKAEEKNQVRDTLIQAGNAYRQFLQAQSQNQPNYNPYYNSWYRPYNQPTRFFRTYNPYGFRDNQGNFIFSQKGGDYFYQSGDYHKIYSNLPWSSPYYRSWR